MKCACLQVFSRFKLTAVYYGREQFHCGVFTVYARIFAVYISPRLLTHISVTLRRGVDIPVQCHGNYYPMLAEILVYFHDPKANLWRPLYTLQPRE